MQEANIAFEMCGNMFCFGVLFCIRILNTAAGCKCVQSIRRIVVKRTSNLNIIKLYTNMLLAYNCHFRTTTVTCHQKIGSNPR